MRLLRNTIGPDYGKYAIIDLRKYSLEWLEEKLGPDVVQTATPNSEDEFFVIKLKDEYSTKALAEYANAAYSNDKEYANEILELARRSGKNNKWCKKPD